MTIKAGQMLEDRSRINIGFYKGVSQSFEAVSPVIAEAQLGIASAIAESLRKSTQLMRKTISGRNQ